MAFVTKAEAYVISELKSTIMDRLHMGGSFLQQVPTVTIGGLPVAIKEGGIPTPAGLGGLADVASAIQSSGLSSLVSNPMGALQGALGDSISGLSSQLGSLTSQLTGGQLSDITSALGNMSSSLSDFTSHTDLLSGVTSSLSETVPDLKKLMDTGNTLKSLTNEASSDFIQNTASSLFADQHLGDIKEELNVTVMNKMKQIAKLDANTDAAQINTLVEEIKETVQSHANTLQDYVTNDVHNFNEAGNNLTASAQALSMAANFADTTSASYLLLNRVGGDTLMTGLNSATANG